MPAQFSIIVPSLDQPDFVEACIKSILAQEAVEVELLVVDGGSDRPTLEILERYQSAFTSFESRPDRGQVHAINKGLELARGKLVSWLNTDDYLEPAALKTVWTAYEKDSNCPFYFGQGYRSDATGQHRSTFYPHDFRFSRKALLWGENFILQPSAFINGDDLKKIGPRLDDSLEYAFDSDLWIKLSALGSPCYLATPLATSREHDQSKTAQGGWKRFEEIRTLALRHTGCELTPGAFHVLTGILYRQLSDPEIGQRIPAEVLTKAMLLWEQSGIGLRNLSGRSDGFPIAAHNEAPETEKRDESGLERVATSAMEAVLQALNISESDRAARGQQVRELADLLRINKVQAQQLADQLAELTSLLNRSEADRSARLETNDRLSSMLRESEQDRQRRLATADQLANLLQHSEKDRSERLSTIDNLTKNLRTSEKDRAQRLENNDRLSRILAQIHEDLLAKDEALLERERRLLEKDHELRTKDSRLANKDETLREKDQQLMAEIARVRTLERELAFLRLPFWERWGKYIYRFAKKLSEPRKTD